MSNVVARMFRSLDGFVGLMLAAACAHPTVAQTPAEGGLAIAHAHVVDVERGRVLRDQTVVIRGDRIVAMGPSARTRVPQVAEMVDARGAFLIPGLWDMHAHTDSAMRVLPLHVANGVTGIRVMAGTPRDLAVRDAIARGERVGPRMVVGTPLVDGPIPVFPEGIVAVQSPARAPAVVDSLHAQGYDFLKIYSALPRETYLALANRAREIAMPFAGHLPLEVSLRDAMAAGQASYEHLIGLQLGCARNEVQLRQELRDTYARASTLEERVVGMFAIGYRPIPTFDRVRCDALIQQLARARAWQVPTLVTTAAFTAPTDSANAAGWADSRLRYLPAREWEEQRGLAMIVPADSMRRVYEQSVAFVARLNRAGVPLLAGTDAPTLYTVPGVTLHDELALLVRAGLTPLEALRTATLNPARYFGATDSLGSIARGKRADLVLLDGNPLTDIANTRRIRSVVLHGRYLDRAALDRMLANAKQDARR